MTVAHKTAGGYLKIVRAQVPSVGCTVGGNRRGVEEAPEDQARKVCCGARPEWGWGPGTGRARAALRFGRFCRQAFTTDPGGKYLVW